MSDGIKIPLSGGQYFAIVDEEDFERVNQYTWSASWESAKRSKLYALTRVRIEGKRVGIKLHRFVMNLPPYLEDPERKVVHHRNARETLDCRKSNLVIVTQFVNLLHNPNWQRPAGYPLPPSPGDNYELCHECGKATDASAVFVCSTCRVGVWV
jgi:hypothetical protein